MSAFEVYRKVYRDLITPVKVTELLILNSQMPRSLRISMVEVYENLLAVTNERSKETLRRSGELQASLKFGRIEDVFARGLHEYLTQFIIRVNDLGNRISNDFLVPMSAS